jgi:hypothetical protein
VADDKVAGCGMRFDLIFEMAGVILQWGRFRTQHKAGALMT